VVICLERGAGLHMVQLMPLGSPEKMPLNGCMCSILVLLGAVLYAHMSYSKDRIFFEVQISCITALDVQSFRWPVKSTILREKKILAENEV